MGYDFTNFRAVYDQYTDEVLHARATFFNDHLKRWLKHIDRSSHSGPIIQRLQNGLDFEKFWQESEKTAGKSLGAGRLVFPDDNHEHRLGYLLLLFRSIALEQRDAMNVATAAHQHRPNVR